ncbi:hypothetical protein [Streptomyces sp. NPDC003327]
MSGEPGRRTRLLTGGCVAVLGVCLVLALAVPVVVTLLIRGLGRPAEPETTVPEPTRSELTRQRLESAAGDGELTDAELGHAAGGNPRTRKDGGAAITVTVTYPAASDPADPGGCYRFVLALPLSLDTRVGPPARGEDCGTEDPAAAPTAGR